tara:strand:+ start:471 stop:746 length:276 start_codon:yes stop_codon:yes gene_type:complete
MNDGKMMPDEAASKGGDILYHLIQIYDQIEWGDSEGEFVRVSMFKNKSMSIINHKDVEQGLAPTTFTLNEDGEWGVDLDGDKRLIKDEGEE